MSIEWLGLPAKDGTKETQQFNANADAEQHSKNMTTQTDGDNTSQGTPEKIKASDTARNKNFVSADAGQNSESMIGGAGKGASSRATMGGKPVFTVPNKTIINFKSGFAPKLLCDDMTFTAGTCCQYSCSFCSVPTTMRKHMPWMRAHGVVGDHQDVVVRRENAIEILRGQIMSKPEAFRQKKQVIYSSPLVDVASNMELVYETVEICKAILELTNWDIRLLSKSNLLPKLAVAIREWSMTEAKPTASSRIIYGVSTGTLDDNLAKAFEEGTPLVSKRIESLHWLQDNGFRTFGMICPSLPQEDYFAFSQKIADAIRVDKCEHVWAEIINLRGESFDRTIAALLAGEFSEEAHRLLIASQDKNAWEQYARRTFEAHTNSIPPNKLRFLQYVNKQTRPWWQEREAQGAVLL